ncbi:MAG: Glyoxalase/bleomycin resistance protein/dioxygenase [Chloroflexi bacterium]|nr:Glyoxalase/bleomycin resistance protein/dioxygenase [Chloroflexota bacterium]
MPVTMDHMLVPVRDNEESARFVAHILGLPYKGLRNRFAPVRLSDGLILDFATSEKFEREHYAFKVSEEEFDQIFARIKESGLIYGSEPRAQDNMEINTHRGGRGVYFKDPSGHSLEVITATYQDDNRPSRPNNAQA